MKKEIHITGAKEHNLKGFDIKIPHNQFVVITGVSGSGKTSLAFDTIYSEGQRRYIESLSSYARQFLELSRKPDVTEIEGLTPSIAIKQRTLNVSPRSIVGTTTEIYDYMRVLFARAGTVHCYKCGRVVTKTTSEKIVEKIKKMTNKRIYILSPIVKQKKGTFEKLFNSLYAEGFIRIIVDGEEKRLDDGIPKLEKNKQHTISLVVDRISTKKEIDEKRISSSVELALKKGEGKIVVFDKEEEKLFSENFGCPYCDIYYDEIEPRTFSFNNPAGACEVCNGLGFTLRMDKTKILQFPKKSIENGAVPIIQRFTKKMVEQLLEFYGESIKTPFEKLPKKVQNAVLYGSKEEIDFAVSTTGMKHSFKKKFEGIIPMLERRYKETESQTSREELEKFLVQGVCPKCNGKRLKEKALAVKIGGMNIFEMCELPVEKLYTFLKEEKNLNFNDFQKEVAKKPLNAIIERLGFLVRVGIGYITLNRRTSTLSGGESQRIHLASQIGSALTGVTYVLDEPSIGLHSEDTHKLISLLKELRDLGNNVIVVEHDKEIIESADFLVDLGPGAGEKGGELIFCGKSCDILKSKNSLTAKYLTGKLSVEIPEKKRKSKSFIKLKGAYSNNLKNIDIEFPLNTFTVVTGVSGSGKSSLVMETLLPALLGNKTKLKKITIPKTVKNIVKIDQSPIGKTPRSNPATYTKIFDYIRTLFASVPESKALGYKSGRFSFNVKGGRCETCQGAGVIRVEMNLMPDTFVVCPECGGKRFHKDTLDIKFNGYTIYDILEMEISKALKVFSPFPAIKRKLELLENIGLGYLKLGQPAHTLSGGEAQRIKLSKELGKKQNEGTVYILDEPTTGLHFDDVKKLIAILQKLVDKNNTVIVIEHNTDVIKSADYIIDLGPFGGEKGGEIVAKGTPEEIVAEKKSLTGKHLKKYLEQKNE